MHIVTMWMSSIIMEIVTGAVMNSGNVINQPNRQLIRR